MSGNGCAMLTVAACADVKLYVLMKKLEGTRESKELDHGTPHDLSREFR